MYPLSRRITSKPLGKITKFRRTFPSVYPISQRNDDNVEGVGVYEQMLKAGLRFLLSSLHRELFKCLGLFVNQVSPNAWKIFIAMEILYGAMTDGARSLTVREFLHYYCSDEIDKSRGVYSFVPKSPLLKVIYETPNSNRD